MSKFKLYYHGGSKNHGCEAIVRATKKILGADVDLYSVNPTEDILYGLDNIMNIIEDTTLEIKRNSLSYYLAAISHKLNHDDYRFIKLIHKDFFNSVNKGDIYFSVGGDNYCYKGRDILAYYNKCIHKKGGKTVLWGCSCGSEDIDASVAKDLALYDLIVTREKISFETLKKINPNTFLLPDPAFQLDEEELPLPKGFEKNIVGINLSPLILEYGNGDAIFNGYKKLVDYVLNFTDYKVLLIPHVVKDGNDDRTILKKLLNQFNENAGRITIVDDCNCMQLKGYISRCNMFVGARTHATIAAYSTCVPTLVIGYSIKSIGIARELFGTDKNYVIPVQNLTDENELVENFKWLEKNQESIREYLTSFIPEYKSRLNDVEKLIKKL